jgi:hypothetical protein
MGGPGYQPPYSLCGPITASSCVGYVNLRIFTLISEYQIIHIVELFLHKIYSLSPKINVLNVIS